MARKNGRKKKSRGAGVPRRKEGESWTAYHDRLSALAAEADEAGDPGLSARLQTRAGKIAAERPQVAKRKRGATTGPRRGPGTYPWNQCIQDQLQRDGNQERAKAICGRIRADSRSRYSAYWEARESNPKLGNRGGPPGKPYAALALDGGPHTRNGQPRDVLVVLDRHGTILEIRPILGDHSLQEFDRTYPDVPIFGPLAILASNMREIIRSAERGTVVVESRKPIP